MGRVIGGVEIDRDPPRPPMESLPMAVDDVRCTMSTDTQSRFSFLCRSQHVSDAQSAGLPPVGESLGRKVPGLPRRNELLPAPAVGRRPGAIDRPPGRRAGPWNGNVGSCARKHSCRRRPRLVRSPSGRRKRARQWGSPPQRFVGCRLSLRCAPGPGRCRKTRASGRRGRREAQSRAATSATSRGDAHQGSDARSAQRPPA